MMHPRCSMHSCLAVTPLMLFPSRLRATSALWALFAIRTACSVQSNLGSNHNPSHRSGREGITVKSRPGPNASFRTILVLQIRPAAVERVKCMHSVLAESKDRPMFARCLESTP